MANPNKLSLNKEQLTRLQDEQLRSIAGGDTEFTTPIDIEAKVATANGLQVATADVESCCKKSCRNS